MSSSSVISSMYPSSHRSAFDALAQSVRVSKVTSGSLSLPACLAFLSLNHQSGSNTNISAQFCMSEDKARPCSRKMPFSRLLDHFRGHLHSQKLNLTVHICLIIRFSGPMHLCVTLCNSIARCRSGDMIARCLKLSDKCRKSLHEVSPKKSVILVTFKLS